MSYSRFLLESAAVVAVLLLIGYWPTVEWGGRAAILAMVVGCTLSGAASLAGALPIWLARHKTPQETLPAMMGSIALRFASVIALATAAAFSRRLDIEPLLLWVAISYFGLLVVDVRYALSRLNA